MTLTGSQLIGTAEPRQGTRTFTGFDPTTSQPLEPVFAEATPAEVDEAVRKAHAALATYRRTSGADKARFLEAIAEEIGNLGDALLETAQRETALPLPRLTGERGRTMNQLKLFAELVREGSWVDARLDSAQPDRQPAPKPDLRSMLRPLGVAGVFGASNFPLAFSVAGGDTASALAAGCPVVFKAHPAHPATCEWVGRAIVAAAQRTGMPDGVFSMVQGTSTEVGMALVQHPLVSAVGFTGSFRGGKALFDAAARREVPIPVYAEMGSTNPVFFLPGVLAEKGEVLARQLVASVTLGVGQFCTNPGVFVVEKSGEPFVTQVADALRQTPGGTLLTAGIRQSYERGLETLSAATELLAHGTATEGQVRPALLKTTAAAVAQQPELLEEVFGPSTVAVTADSRAEVLQLARELPGHITATIWGTEADLRDYAELLDILEQKVGRVLVNGFPTGVEVTHAMVHGGPYPATTDARSTSVGTAAILRFARPVCYQDVPDFLLPDELKTPNPLGIWRLVDGERVH
jgi:alpha-ketoglutaric semialdehyde dehydrogenase